MHKHPPLPHYSETRKRQALLRRRRARSHARSPHPHLHLLRRDPKLVGRSWVRSRWRRYRRPFSLFDTNRDDQNASSELGILMCSRCGNLTQAQPLLRLCPVFDAGAACYGSDGERARCCRSPALASLPWDTAVVGAGEDGGKDGGWEERGGIGTHWHVGLTILLWMTYGSHIFVLFF